MSNILFSQISRTGLLAALALAGSAAVAQGPGGPPPGPGGHGAGPPMVEIPLTEGQKLVKDLPAAMPGVLIPVPPVPADAPMPAKDPHDLQGTWYHNQPLEMRMQKDMYGMLAPYNVAGAKVLGRRVKATAAGNPYVNASAKCRPAGPQWQRDLNMPFSIFQTKDTVEFVFEEYHGRWMIALDPAAHPAPAEKQYMGRSVGHWDGSTLVVETSDFRQPIWLDVDGTPLSANGKIIHRIRKVDQGDGKPYLAIESTFVDPAYYDKPWSVVRSFGWQPNLALFKEYNCEEQIGDPSGTPDAGLVPEPKD